MPFRVVAGGIAEYFVSGRTAQKFIDGLFRIFPFRSHRARSTALMAQDARPVALYGEASLNIISHSFSVAMHSSTVSIGAKWSLIMETTGASYVVMPRPEVPSSAVTTHATWSHFGIQRLRWTFTLGYRDIGFATSASSAQAGRQTSVLYLGDGSLNLTAFMSLIFIYDAPYLVRRSWSSVIIVSVMFAAKT